MTDKTIARARVLLTPVADKANPYAVLGAAAMAAMAAVLMAGVMVLGPGVRFDEPVVSAQP
ncbi:MAG TPA: peptidoglycan-binding protein [Brevundimonas sp.]|nr:peptidoglycan-binding protein [Brevundimonas sp.]